jgi:hypothetical protein
MGDVHYNVYRSKSKVLKLSFNKAIFQYNQILNPNSLYVQGVFPFNQFLNPINFLV